MVSECKINENSQHPQYLHPETPVTAKKGVDHHDLAFILNLA